jgi:hypothetical protein
MNEAELKSLWQRQELQPPVSLPDAEIMNRMRQKLRQFDRNIFRRDMREGVACAVVVGMFLWEFFVESAALARTGCIVVIAAAVVIFGKLVVRRHFKTKRGEPDSVKEFLEKERRKMTREIFLLRSVFWWYILPLLVGEELFVFGLPRPLANKLVATAVCVAVSGFVYWLNQRAVRKYLVPLQEEMETAARVAEQMAGEPGEQDGNAKENS